MPELDPEHIKRIAKAIAQWRTPKLPTGYEWAFNPRTDWKPALKPDLPKRQKPFLTAADIVMLREMKVGL